LFLKIVPFQLQQPTANVKLEVDVSGHGLPSKALDFCVRRKAYLVASITGSQLNLHTRVSWLLFHPSYEFQHCYGEGTRQRPSKNGSLHSFSQNYKYIHFPFFYCIMLFILNVAKHSDPYPDLMARDSSNTRNRMTVATNSKLVPYPVVYDPVQDISCLLMEIFQLTFSGL
jgi:hypothetical protein